jgi:cysteine desulfurase / selenocysteine lyase
MLSIDITQNFALDEHIVYLNHAASAPWPRRTAEAVQRFAEENMRQGSKNYLQWKKKEEQLREQLHILLNAPVEDIALLKNTSEALSVVAYGLTWQAGDNIIITDQEFPSNRIVWESLKNQGVIVHYAPIGKASDPEAALLDLVNSRTRLISVSSVQYASGLRLDLAKIGAFCHSNQVLFCIDAIQSLGALQFDAHAIHADFVMADAHKWLLGPEGIAVFYCHSKQREQLQLNEFGWHMIEAPNDFQATTWQVANSARRFECGSPNMLGIHALSASLSLFAEVGMANIEAQILDNTRYLLDGLSGLKNIDILSPQEPHRYAGIVTFRHQKIDSTTLRHHLSDKGIICVERGGGIRFSPHFYTPREHLKWAVEQVAQYCD